MPETSSPESAPKHRSDDESETEPEQELETSPETETETTADETTADETTTDETTAEKSPEKQGKTKRPSRWARWIAVAALVVAVIAAAGAGAAWHRLTQISSPKYSDQESGQAKKNLCGSYGLVQRAIAVSNHVAPPNPNDPTGRLAVQVNNRQALVGGAIYLRDRIAAEPAASSDLKKILAATATEIEQLAMLETAGASADAQEPLRKNLEAKVSRIKELCT